LNDAGKQMDWAGDNLGVNDRDLDNVFKYEEKYTSVVRILDGDAVQRNPKILPGLECQGASH